MDAWLTDSLGVSGSADRLAERVGLSSDAVREGRPGVFDPVGAGSPADPSPPQAVRTTTSNARAAATPAVFAFARAVVRRGPVLTSSPSAPNTRGSVSHLTPASHCGQVITRAEFVIKAWN